MIKLHISRFWKKSTVFNLGILIICLRIYGFIIFSLNKYSENIYIFPKVGENGYPFEESINYNLEEINNITTSLIKKNKSLQPIISYDYNKCTLKGKIKICKNNDSCFDEIKNIKEGKFEYHKNASENSNNLINNNYILELIKEQNKFKIANNIEIELPFYYKIIDGYSAYLSVLSNDIDSIKIITTNENKVNNLIFLYILYLRAYTYKYKTNDIYIERLLANQEKKVNEEIDSLDKSNIEQLLKIMNINIKDEIINCIPDLDMRYSFLEDFKSIIAMIEVLFKIKRNDNENKIFDFLFEKLTKTMNDIFYLDKNANTKINILSIIKKYMFYVYWIICIIIIYYLNKEFIKRKEFYEEGKIGYTKSIDNAEYKKLLKYKKNLLKIQKANRNKYTKEEIDMINKLTKDQKDFIISK